MHNMKSGTNVCINLTFMVVEYSMFLGMPLSVHHFHPELNISKAIGWIIVLYTTGGLMLMTQVPSADKSFH